MKFKSIDEVGDLKGERVILRLDLNVPIVDGGVQDDFRIKKSLPTIEFLRAAGARVIIISHLEGKGGDSLEPVYIYLKKLFPLKFIKNYPSVELTVAIKNLKGGEVLMLENLRLNLGEKANDESFAKELAAMGDLYVNEAFSASHREHASIVGIPKFIPAYAGLLFKKEVENLSRAFQPAKPFLLVLGGAKFETKMPVIEKFLKTADHIFVCGALANNFFREQGYEIGRSLVSEGDFGLKNLLASGKIILPLDVVVQNDKGQLVQMPEQVESGDAIWDAGPAAVTQLKELVGVSRFVLWNGPLGNYEIGFKQGTEELAKIIAESGVESIVGGGDTQSSINSLGLSEKFTFLSTAGGAMLDFLVDETLVGIEALEK